MPPDDLSLLKHYVHRRDDDSFRLLSERYLGLIFHTALRRTGNHALSQDISQAVLCDLAKKSSSLLKAARELGPWLHRATIYQSSKAMRSEQSQQKWKEQCPPDPEPSPMDWQEALPHLDEALDKLSTTDRRILILHFFDHFTFPKIAALIGKSPAATQKQSRRALEKLSGILRRKGITLSAVVLTSSLATEFAKAAPAGFVTTVPILAPPSALSTFFAMNLSKPTLAASAMLLAIPLGLQQMQIHGKEMQLQKIVSSPTTRYDSSKPSRPTHSSAIVSRDIATLVRDLFLASKRDDLYQLLQTFDTYFQSLNEDQLIELLLKATSGAVANKHQIHLTDTILSQLSHNPPLLFDTVFEIYQRDSTQDLRLRVVHFFVEWAKNDLNAAQSWFIEKEASGAFRNPHAIAQKGNSLANTYLTNLLVQMVQERPTEIASFLSKFSEPNQSRNLLNLGKLLDISQSDSLLDLTHGTFDQAHTRALLTGLAQRFSSQPGGRLQGIQQLLQKPRIPAAHRDHLIQEGANAILNTNQRHSSEGKIEAAAIPPVMDWLRSENPEHASTILGNALAQNGFPRSQQLILNLLTQSEDHSWLPAYLTHEGTHRYMNQPNYRRTIFSFVERIADPVERERVRTHLDTLK